MKITKTRIPDVKLIEPKVFGDERGFFMETWNEKAFQEAGIDVSFVQDNHSRSRKGTLRGLHYQINYAQGKLVRVTQGAVLDVAVDMRRSSPTFGQWVAENLTADNKRMLWVPPGFAHGFYVLSESADFLYKCTERYSPTDERCIRWDDPTLAIEWALIDGERPLVSEKDSAGCLFLEAEAYS
ncbi:dTDP-4-dehydrorhamnose 3,5-epimerase [Marinobacter sp.]|uniref:dTDP-4-dehydrorhamnose 3,5-epimerase n=1 Tax=Marinobacter sp. TaxID=50741 RepID=UPI002B26D93F|nr:dTDP-4-dehydrorhamnose 3,5-epimerase [Marinobacter sp.]